MPHFRITLAYDGTGFVGWQRQAEGVSIQGLLEDALRILDGRGVVATGASRTDAGVHALGQVAGFALAREIDADTVVRALNARLPQAVRVLDAAEVPPSFHPRFDARAKTYRYRIWNHEVMAPFERSTSWHVPAPKLDIEKMDAAARLIEGRHDFAAFQATGTEVPSTERTVFSSRVFLDAAAFAPGREAIVYEVRGEGFLRHMVRALAGTLVEVGRGRQQPDWVGDVLRARRRGLAGRTAPAHGLFLVRIEYE